jgi:hypothetical protein
VATIWTGTRLNWSFFSQKDLKIFNTNIPINLARMIPGMRRTQGIKNYLQELCIKIGAKYGIKLDKTQTTKQMLAQIIDYKQSVSYKSDLNDVSKSYSKINKIDEVDIEILEQIESVINLRNKSSILNALKGKNIELQLNSELHNLINLVNNHDELKKDFATIPIIYCKSGKDRTGIQVEKTQAVILSTQLHKHLKQENQNTTQTKSDLQKNLLVNSLANCHVVSINGSSIGGNALGNQGILNNPDIRTYLGQESQTFAPLFNQNANLTHINVKTSGPSKSFNKISSITSKLTTKIHQGISNN